MAEIELNAPNGRKISLPTGLFINNEFVAGSSKEKLATIDPSLVAASSVDHNVMKLIADFQNGGNHLRIGGSH